MFIQSDVTVVILAAGLSTRMKSNQAKGLHCAGGQTLIRHAVDAARAIAPPERIFVVVGHQAEKVRENVEDPGGRSIVQPEHRGSWHALLWGRSDLGEPAGRT